MNHVDPKYMRLRFLRRHYKIRGPHTQRLFSNMDFGDDKHLDVCQNIEAGLKNQYEINPHLTDSICVRALDGAKIAIKQQFGYAQSERVASDKNTQAVVDWCVGVGMERIDKINGLTLKEYVARIEKIRASVARHAGDGNRSYYHFIKQCLP